jgi:hypothetical protein
MARRRRNSVERLRNAVEALPRHTKEAMLRGIRGNRIIVGAYSDKRGGVCPMLAAHRNGGRTNMGTFARAWDEYTGADPRRPRRASVREVRALQNYLELALLGDEWSGRPLTREVEDIQASRRRLAEAAAREAADLTVDDVLARTYAAAEERRAEARAGHLLDAPDPEADPAIDALAAESEPANADSTPPGSGPLEHR